MSLASINYVVSQWPLDHSDQLERVKEVPSSKEERPYVVYEQTPAVSRVRLTDTPQVISSVEEFVENLVSEGYTDAPAFIEEAFWTDDQTDVPLEYEAAITENGNRSIRIDVSSNKEALLVLADLYYPGWEAYVDDQLVEYYPVNLIQRALVVPEGDHTVEMRYSPLVYERGKAVSAWSHFIVLVAVFLLLFQRKLFSLPKRQ